MVMSATVEVPMKALGDLLIALREQVPISDAQIVRATGADSETVATWLTRRAAPAGLQAQRVAELVAFTEEMARNVPGADLVGWLDGHLDLFDGANPLDEIAVGHYERMIDYALGLSYGTFV